MTTHEFIFSDQRRHRITRHLVFWLAWWMSYSLLFHIPVLELKGWGLNRQASPATFRDVEIIGPYLYALKILIFNSLLAVVLPQALLTYFLLYWLMPKRFYRNKNPFVTAALLLVVLVAYRFLAIQFLWFAPIGNQVFGLPYKLPTYDLLFRLGGWTSLRQQLGSLPILIGIAVMITHMKRWWLKEMEIEQVAREKTKAELQLLKAQVHPHFLFNTLNNIYFFILSASPKAPEMITKLSGLLHYILNECNQPLVSLDKEIRMIEDYVSLEKIRYGNELNMSIELPGDCSNKLIAPLLLIPFVENSFKHGASKMLTHPYVNLKITIEGNRFYFYIRNSRPEMQDPDKFKGNIGLKNVKKRLELLYPHDHELTIVEEPGSFAVSLKIELNEKAALSEINETIKTKKDYAVA